MKITYHKPKPPQEYDVISIDPPWQYKVWDKDTGQGRSAESHYSTITFEQLCKLPVLKLAAPNCAIFMWCTWPTLF